MKSKNVALLGIAVGCGLIAAIVTAKLGAGSKSGPEMVQVIVAKKDLPIGTKLDEKELPELLTYAQMPKQAVAPDTLTDLELLKNKTLNRTLKLGNPITATDVGAGGGVSIPEGFSQMTIKVDQVAAVAGFAKPGSKVDILFTETLQNGRAKSYILLRDMLILAVNTTDRLQEGQAGSNAIPQVESVSLAVNDKQSGLLTLAEKRGTLKLKLRNLTVDPKEDGKKLDVIESLPGDAETGTAAAATAATPAIAMEGVVVAKTEVPTNTQITAENVTQYFEIIDYPVSVVPEKAIKDFATLKNKFVIKELDARLPLLSSALADAPLEPKAEPTTPEPKVEKPITRVKPRQYEQVIIQGGEVKRTLYIETEAGSGKYRAIESDKDLEKIKNEQPEAPKADESKPVNPAPSDRAASIQG